MTGQISDIAPICFIQKLLSDTLALPRSHFPCYNESNSCQKTFFFLLKFTGVCNITYLANCTYNSSQIYSWTMTNKVFDWLLVYINNNQDGSLTIDQQIHLHNSCLCLFPLSCAHEPWPRWQVKFILFLNNLDIIGLCFNRCTPKTLEASFSNPLFQLK